MPKPPKTRCGNQWTEARFKGFIISALRRASSRWSPKYTCKKNAKIAYNRYECALCREIVGNKNIKVDHIEPVVDPKVGFIGYDEFIKRLFVEIEGFQAVCTFCHQKKTNSEREQRETHTPKKSKQEEGYSQSHLFKAAKGTTSDLSNMSRLCQEAVD